MSITYGEIKGQYAALEQTDRYLTGLREPLHAMLSPAKGIVFVGSGSSYYVARSAALMARLRLGQPSLSLPAGDLLLHLPTYRPALEGAAIVVLSRSGETSEAILAVKAMREAGISFSLIAVTCVSGSSLSAMSDLALEMPWAFDKSVCQTRTVTCLYAACLQIMAMLAEDAHTLSALRSTVQKGSAYMEKIEPALSRIAKMDWTHAIVLGDGEMSGLCEEGALAFKEICQLPSNYYHLLDVRHGPMVLIGQKTLVIAALSSLDKLELGLIQDIVDKGATVIVYSDTPTDLPGTHSVSFGEALPHAVRGIPFILICQLITYHKAFLTGANPDQPDGLSAWISLK